MKKIVFNEKDMNFIIKAYQNNEMTTLELAEKFNCSRYTIERRLKENGVILKARFKYENLIGRIFGNLTVISEDLDRYNKELESTNKPHKYWWCKCSCGKEQLVSVEGSKLKSGHTTSCGCIKSLAEQKITKILQENKINFKSEFICPNLKGCGGGYLRFDFAILDKNNNVKYFIEYNGKQHYFQNGGWNTEQEFANRVANDKIKSNYCKINNIPLIVIPYTVKPEDISIKDLVLKEVK